MSEEINKIFLKLDQLKRAEKLMLEMLGSDLSPNVGRFSVIKSFELCYELGWKLMKILLEVEYDKEITNPKDAITMADAKGIIDNPKEWIKAREYRNYMTHTYDIARADDVEEFARTRFPEMVRDLVEFAERRLKA